MEKLLYFLLVVFVAFAGFVLIKNIDTEKINYNNHYDEEYNPRKFLKAALDNDLEKVKEFIQKGMNPNVTNDRGRTALFIAVKNNNFEMTKFLLESNANPNIKDFYDDSPLTIATYGADAEIVKLLQEYGAK